MASISGSSAPLAKQSQWQHRTPIGVEYGGETPTGTGRSPFAALSDTIAETLRLRKTLWLIVVYDFKSRYRAQALGMFWSIGNPLIMMAVLTVAFTQILRIPIPNFPVFYLVGGVQWHFFVSAVTSGTSSLATRTDLVKRTSLPRHFAPLAAVMSATINLGLEVVVLFGFYFVFPDAYRFGLNLLWLLPIALTLVLMSFGISLMTSSLYVRFRDTENIVNSLTMVGFWVTPILYSTDMAPRWLANFLRLNPLAGTIESARGIVMHDQAPTLSQLTPSILFTAMVLVLGTLIFRKANLTFADHV